MLNFYHNQSEVLSHFFSDSIILLVELDHSDGLVQVLLGERAALIGTKVRLTVKKPARVEDVLINYRRHGDCLDLERLGLPQHRVDVANLFRFRGFQRFIFSVPVKRRLNGRIKVFKAVGYVCDSIHAFAFLYKLLRLC